MIYIVLIFIAVLIIGAYVLEGRNFCFKDPSCMCSLCEECTFEDHCLCFRCTGGR